LHNMENTQNTIQEELTAEQKDVVKNFAGTIRSDYNQMRKNGLSPQAAYSAVSGRTNKEIPVAKKPITFNSVVNKITDIDPLGGLKIVKGAAQAGQSGFINKLSEEARVRDEGIANQLIERLKLAKEEGDVAKINKWTELLSELDYGADISKGYTDDLVTNKEVIGSGVKLAGTIAGGFVGSKIIWR